MAGEERKCREIRWTDVRRLGARDGIEARNTRKVLVLVALAMSAAQVSRAFSHARFLRRRSLFRLSGARDYASKGTVGFVGLGNMGRPMAKNLMKNDYPVVAYDVVPAAAELCRKDGATIAKTPAELAELVDVAFTMLPTNQHVLDCYLGPKGILEGARKGTILVDSSTVDPSVPAVIEKKANEKGISFADAPVSGGIIGAQDGTLTFMVGGDEKVYNAIKSILECMGNNVVHCGKIGCGQAAKICNNMLLGITMLGVSEALNLGARLGLDPKLLTGIINTSTGRCWSSEVYNPVPGILPNVPSSKNYEGGFMSKLMCKDLGLAQDSATRLQCSIPLGSATHQFYRLLLSSGDGDKDFAFVYQYLKGKI